MDVYLYLEKRLIRAVDLLEGLIAGLWHGLHNRRTDLVQLPLSLWIGKIQGSKCWDSTGLSVEPCYAIAVTVRESARFDLESRY